jgi:DNA repair protein RecO (recombination protein O)
VSVLAKGTKKEKSTFGGPLDLFYRGESAIVFRPRSGLNLLTGFAVDQTFPRLRTDLRRFYAACHLAEILAGMTREEEPHPQLFDLVDAGLRLLSDAPVAELPALLASLETRTLAELGFAPSLAVCASCGKEGTERGAALSAALGGMLCADCAERDPDARPAPPGRIAALRTLAREPPDRAGRVRLSAADARAIRAWLTSFAEWRLERRLRTARFL